MTNYQGYWSNAKLKQYAPAHLDFFAIKHGKRYKHGVNTMKYLTSTSAYYQLYKTTIVTYHMLNQVITLNSGGYRTVTTKSRMNHLLLTYDIPYQIVQRQYIWYMLRLTYGTPPFFEAQFHDGITLSKDGILTAPNVEEMNAHKIRMLGKYITKAFIKYSENYWLYPNSCYLGCELTWTIPKMEGALNTLSHKVADSDGHDLFNKLASHVLHWLERDDLLNICAWNAENTPVIVEEVILDNVGDWVIAGLEDKL